MKTTFFFGAERRWPVVNRLGLPFMKDAKALSFIHARARSRYREGMPQLGKDVGGKVRKLIDDHVVSLGIDPKIPPIPITDAKFEEHVDRLVSPRAKASEMQHAARHHIRKRRPGLLLEALGAA